MQRTISVIERNAKGSLAVVADRIVIECDDDRSGIIGMCDERKAAGATEIIVLLQDGSVGLHWTKPEEPAQNKKVTSPGARRAK